MVMLISFILVIIGALNWLMVSLFQLDLVATIFGSQADIFARIIYGLVGLAGLILLYASIKERGYLNVCATKDADEELIRMDNRRDLD